MSALWTGLILAQLASPAPPGPVDLTAAAAASPRPRECRGDQSRASDSHRVWTRARRPELARYCAALALGYTRLRRAPADALAAAASAKRALPKRAESSVLQGRASLALGRAQAAFQAFSAARAQSPTALDDPGALHDYARAALASGHTSEALAAYRRLAQRALLLESRFTMQTVYIEAAALALWRGPDGIDEALGYVREARRITGTPGLQPFAAALHALALDRQGRRAEAKGVLSEAAAGVDLERLARSPSRPQLPPGELRALIAISAEADNAALARTAWRECLNAAPQSPWSAHARARLAQLGGAER